MPADLSRRGLLRAVSPATGEPVGEAATDDAEAIERKLLLAERAQRAWARRAYADRAAAIARFAERLAADAEPLARLQSQETGKPIRQARAEIAATGGRIAWFLEHAPGTLAGEVVHASADGALEERMGYDPLGVCVNISAWNYPFFVGVNVLVPALLAGNAVVYKPSEHAALLGREIVRRLVESGVPAGALALAVGGGEAGRAAIRAPTRAVFFTGSYATGVKVAEAAAPHLIRVALELGGKDPLYVTEDVDPAWAAAVAAEGAFYNAGQSCCAVERIYVHERVAEPFERALVEEARRLVVGDPLDPATDMGPLCLGERHVALIERRIADALRQGARLAAGGGRPPSRGRGSFLAPTVLLDARASMELMVEETFGPVAPVERVAGDDEALARMADTRYGLTAAVLCRDRARAEGLLAELPTGSAYWNCCDRVSPRLPWSGRGRSGYGVTLSRHGILAFVEPRGWHLKRAPA